MHPTLQLCFTAHIVSNCIFRCLASVQLQFTMLIFHAGATCWAMSLQLQTPPVCSLPQSAVMYFVLLQVLDRAFMTAVLLMTSFWQLTSSPAHPSQQKQATAATSNGKKNRNSGEVTSNSGKATNDLVAADQGSSNTALESDSSSSLIAAQLMDNLSYLQFCRMRLTAYNSLLKTLLTAVSTSAQVSSHSSFCCLLSFYF